MLISFEGIDGAGKSTQIDLLEKYAAEKGMDVLKIREPGGTDFSEKIRNILLDKDTNIPPESELFLFEAARADLVDKIIKPALEEGKLVLCDRFFDSTMAYQGYGRGLDKNTIGKINMMATSNILPSITFYLRIDIKKSAKRNSEKNLDRMELAGIDFFERVKLGFEEISENNEERMKVIDGNNSIIQIHQEIIKYLDF
jgi:dTMP kinase